MVLWWLTFLECLSQVPSITQPPASQTIFHGDPVTFRVTATGGAPLNYQWYRNGVAISAATVSTLALPAVASGDHEAVFSVRITNPLGAVTSAVVVLTVDFGLPGPTITNRVLHFTNVWRFNQSNNLDTVSWVEPGYDDTAWQSGPGLLAAENNAAIVPLIGTALFPPNAPPPGLPTGHAYYFRTTITANNDFIPAALIGTFRADDGAMVYVNGDEALRLRLPGGAITNTSFTTDFPPGGISDATVDEVLPLEVLQLALGTNVIAASVHQANSGSSDLVWGMTLDAVGYLRLRDTVAPTLNLLIPAAGLTVPALNTLEVHFSEGVKGVEAGDLLISGVPATNVTVFGPDVYVFQFAPAPTGAVQIAWSASHGIIDLSANSNSFAGGSYNYTVNPAAVASDVRITEFMAGNTTTIRDNDGEFSDWVEILNGGAQSLNLGGWYLTDNAANPTKWRFPTGLTLPASSYLLVWASDKDRTNLAAPLHTNFKLNKSAGNFLGLVYSDGATVVSSFTSYPQQFDDVSYGRDRIDASTLGYFTNATPGAANATVGAGFASGVKFSRGSGTFRTSFPLTLSAAGSNTVIRYFLVNNSASAALTNVPNGSSPIYTGPLTISSSVQVRARAFSTQPDIFPGEPASETYLQITAGAANFSSDVPIVLFYNFAANSPPASTDQNAVMMVFGTDYGRASLTNPPDLATRIGMNIRGSSTQGLPKQSYAVETWDEYNDDQKRSVLGLPSESDWVFYAPNLFDKPFIHNPFMHEVSRGIGRYSPRVRMVEVFTCFDASLVHYGSPGVGNYNGIYVLEEKIKAGENRVDIPRLDPVQTNVPAITGGYLLKIDRTDTDERGIYAGNQSMVYVEPQMKDYASYPGRAMQENYLAGYFNSFYSALNGASWTNPVTGYAAWIDVDSWVDHHILNVLALSSDALRLSAYFFKDRNRKIEMGPLWDFDRGLGSSADNEFRSWNPRSWMGSNPSGSETSTDFGTDFFNAGNVFGNPWYSRLTQDPNFWQKWIDRYQSLRQTAFSTNALFAVINGLTNKLAPAQAREAIRWTETAPRSGTVVPPAGWPDTSYSHVFPGTYAGEIAFLKRWLTDRVNFIDTNLLARPTLSRTGGLVSAGQTLTLTPAAKAGSRLLFTLNGTDPRLPGGAISPAALSNSGPVTLTLTNNVRVFARSWNPTHQNLTGARNPPISSPWSGSAADSFYTTTPPLRITEIMFHPPPAPPGNTNEADNFEFIELLNTSAAPLNLQGFRLSGGIDFVFPTLTLTGGQHVVVAKHLAAFQSRYGAGVLVAGVFTNNLGNSGDHLVLRGPLLEPILDFTFQDTWYPATDGEGFSLVIVNALAATDTWSAKGSWRPSGALKGSPGSADPTPPNIPPILITEALTHTDPPDLETVELFNPTTGQVDLGGWFLTDDPHDPKKYRIPNGNYITAGGHMTFTSDHFEVGPKAFAFSSTGDQIYLFSGDANTNLTGYAHGFDFGAAPNPVSFGRYVNSQGVEHFVSQSFNTLGLRNVYPRVGPVVISEIMYHPPDLPGGADDDLNEFIELQNIALTNVPLYDVDAATNTWHLRNAVDFDFPTNVVLTPGARLLVVGFDPVIYGSLKASFITRYSATNTLIFGPWSGKLDNGGESLELQRPDHPNVTALNTFVPYYLVEQINYQDASPWPTNADGTGASLQRIELPLFGNDPINWQAATPTAGATNPVGLRPDADRDGLPDLWELANGLDPQLDGANGSTGDPDGDGANNAHEFIAGTHPNDGLDYLHFQRAAVSNQVCVLEFSSRTGRTYAIETAADIAATDPWSALTNGIAGTGGLIPFTDSLLGSPRYYRIKVTLNP